MYRFYKSYRGILQDERLTRTQKVIISILLNRAEFHQNKKFYCYESWIANEAMCSEKTVKRAVKHLETIGLLNITQTYNKDTKKKTNFYTVNFDYSKGKMVEETGASGISTINNKPEEITRVEVKLSAEPQPTYNEIPTTTADNIKDCKVVTEIDKEVLNNVFTYLKSNINEAKKGVVYFPALKGQFGYNYRQVVEAVRELANRGKIEYDPQEKDGKLIHFYSLSTSVVTNKAKFEETLGSWIDLCSTHIGKLTKNSTEDEKKIVLSTLSNYAAAYLENGVTREDLKTAISYVYKTMVV